MRVTRVTSPVSLVLGLLGGLTWRFRALTGGPPVSVYPATRPIWEILGRVTGPTRRSWVWRIMFSVPPRPYLLGFGQPVEHAFLSPPGGIGVLSESELAIVVLDEELDALDQVAPLGRDRALGNAGTPLYLPLGPALILIIEKGRAPIILVELVDGVQYPAVGITQVDHRALAGGLEDAVGGCVVGWGGHYGLLAIREFYDLTIALLEPGMGEHHPDEVGPEPCPVRHVVTVKTEVFVIESEDHAPHRRQAPERGLPRPYAGREILGGKVWPQGFVELARMAGDPTLVILEFSEEHAALELGVEFVADGRDGGRHGSFNLELLSGVAPAAVLVDGEVGGPTSRDKGPEQLDELVHGLCLIQIDPAVRQDPGVCLGQVVQRLAARALEGQEEVLGQERCHCISEVVLAPPPAGDEDHVGAHGLAVGQRRELGAEAVQRDELERGLLPHHPVDLGGVDNKATQDSGATHQGVDLFFSDLGELLRLLGSEFTLGLCSRLDLLVPPRAQDVEGSLEPILAHPVELGRPASVPLT